MNDLNTIKGFKEYLERLKTFIREKDKQDVLFYLNLHIIELDRQIKEIENKKNFDLEL